jgi:hypothetical protein
MENLTDRELSTLFRYDKTTGAIYEGERRVDTPAQFGYRRVRHKGRDYRAHRLAYFLVTGLWPPHDVDHKDLNRSNNVWTNLRPATRVQNQRNHRRSISNTSGIKGVSYVASRGKWLAQLRIGGKKVNLGRFPTKEEAEYVVRTARELHHGEFANHG